jgi:hypothetical protein
MTKFPNKIVAIQMDHIGNFMDILDIEDAKAFKGEEKDFLVTTIEEAIEYKKSHPNKGFFVYNDPDVEAFLKENNAL